MSQSTYRSNQIKSNTHILAGFSLLKTILLIACASFLVACGGGSTNSENNNGGGVSGSTNNGESSDTIAPTISRITPTDGTIIGSPNNKRPIIRVSFSEPVNHVNTSNVVFKKTTTPVAISINGSGKTYTITPSADLVPDTAYSLEFKVGIKDAANNSLSGNNRITNFSAYKQKVSFSAWVGVNNTLLDVNDSLPSGSELYSYRAANYGGCDITNITACSLGQGLLLNGQTITNTAHTLSQTAFYKLKEGSLVSTNSGENTTRFSYRRSHQAVFFKNKFWVIGGYRFSRKNDVWSSPDGIKWTQEKAHKNNPTTADKQFTPRANHQVVVYKNKLWLIGGRDNSGRKNDIWSSTDGISWTQSTPVGNIFSGRENHQVVVFKNKLWVIGGYVNNNMSMCCSDEAWYSSEGVTWRKARISGTFPPRANFQTAVTNTGGVEKLWITGGWHNASSTNYQVRNDVLSSTNGINWTTVLTDNATVSNTHFSQRQAHQMVAFDNKLWLIGGKNGANNVLDDVYSSTDGMIWNKSRSAGIGTRFSPRNQHQVVVANINGSKQLYVIGGYAKYSGNIKINKNDVWRSQDGANWRLGYLGEITRF